MKPSIRQQYNSEFTPEKYQAFLNTIGTVFGEPATFRIAETPVFIPRTLKKHLLKAVREICQVLSEPDFKKRSQAAIPPGLQVPGEDDHTQFLQLDFGICKGPNGNLFPQLIELQGFPSLYFFQLALAESYRKNFHIPEGYNHLFSGYSDQGYVRLLREIIVGKEKPENVILLEIEPEKQNTRIDFWGSAKHLGIKVLCLSKLKRDGRDLYYLDDNGKKIAVKRIYNRIIFDELEKRSDLPREWNLTEPVNATWVGHPNWFFRISKHTLPSLKSAYVPETHFLSDVKTIPTDLENWVLKPLFSFSGMGVKFNVTRADIDAVKDPENFILQRKAEYLPALKAPGDPVKCEIRMMILWKPGWKKPKLVNNLIRLSKGEMVGVRYNKDKDWVGASVGFFES